MKNEKNLALLDKTHEIEREKIKVTMSKGVYDIHYAINLLKSILVLCEKEKFNPRDLQFTLSQGLQKQLAYLEVERDQMFRR